SSDPEILHVDEVSVHRHIKPGSPDSLRVVYRSGLAQVREWICLDHTGFAGSKAKSWWAQRFDWKSAATITVNKALEDMLLADHLKSVTESVTIIRRGKFTEIINHKLRTSK